MLFTDLQGIFPPICMSRSNMKFLLTFWAVTPQHFAQVNYYFFDSTKNSASGKETSLHLIYNERKFSRSKVRGRKFSVYCTVQYIGTSQEKKINNFSVFPEKIIFSISAFKHSTIFCHLIYKVLLSTVLFSKSRNYNIRISRDFIQATKSIRFIFC
jgi:hypothetical protein